MKNIILIVSLAAIFPAHGMDKEPLPDQEPSAVKREARKILIINNTMHRHTISVDRHRYKIHFHRYKWITTYAKTIKIDGTRRILHPENDVLCLGAEPDWPIMTNKPKKEEPAL